MFTQSHFLRAALAVSVLLPLSLMPTSVFAQESVVENLLRDQDTVVLHSDEEVAAVAVEQVEQVEQAEIAHDATMLALTEALQADGMELAVIDAVVEQGLVEQGLVEQKPVEKRPGASALSGLESVGLESADLLGPAKIDLARLGEAFRVESRSVPTLTAALSSENILTQLYAADALWTLTSDRDLILPTLMAAAASDDEKARELAISALAQLGEQALPAVPLLHSLIGDKDSRTRQIAQEALTVVRSDNRPSAVLGIIARETRRRLMPTAIRFIADLF